MGNPNQNQNREPTQNAAATSAPQAAPAATTAPEAPQPSPAASAPSPAPLSVEMMLASMQAKLDAQAAEIAQLRESTAEPAPPSISKAQIAEMAGLGGGTMNSRDENAPVPRHFTHGHPIFRAERPTGKAG